EGRVYLGSSTEAGVSGRMRARMRRQMARVGDGPRAVLKLAAVVGVEFEARVVIGALEHNERANGMLWLDELASRRFIHAVDRAPARFQFAHASQHDAVLSTLNDAERAK